MTKGPCSIEGCPHPAYCRTWCTGHYYRQLRTGSLGGLLPVKYKDPEEAFAARTERRGECLIWTGARHGVGYGSILVDGKQVGAHRYAWERKNGPIPDGKFIDHRLGCDRACVEESHLRPATSRENGRNKPLRSRTNATGWRGVYPMPSGKFEARVTVGKDFHRRTCNTIEEALDWLTEKRTELFGEFVGH